MRNLLIILAVSIAVGSLLYAHDPHPGSFDRGGTDCSVFEGDLWYLCQKMNALSSHVAAMDAALAGHTRGKHTTRVDPALRGRSQ